MQSKNEDVGVEFRTRSGGVTKTITLFFDEGLQHPKLHDRACNFADVKTSAGGSAAHDVDSSAKASLTQQGL
jgi:hypothetical protein